MFDNSKFAGHAAHEYLEYLSASTTEIPIVHSMTVGGTNTQRQAGEPDIK